MLVTYRSRRSLVREGSLNSSLPHAVHQARNVTVTFRSYRVAPRKHPVMSDFAGLGGNLLLAARYGGDLLGHDRPRHGEVNEKTGGIDES